MVLPPEATQGIDTNLTNSAIELAKFFYEPGCTIGVGLDAANPLEIGVKTSTSTIVLAGTGTVYLEFAQSTVGACDIAVQAAGTLNLASNGASDMASTVNITAGSGTVNIGWRADDTCEVNEINLTGGATVNVGRNVTNTSDGAIVTVTVKAGTLTNYADVTTLTNWNGVVTQVEGTVTTIEAQGNTIFYNSEGTPTTCNVYGDGKLDFTDNPNSLDTTTVNVFGSATVDDANGVLAVGTVFDFDNTNATDASVDFGVNRKITTAAS